MWKKTPPKQPSPAEKDTNGSLKIIGETPPPASQPDTSLPESLQKIVDTSTDDTNLYDEIVDGYAPPSTDSNVRYAAYAARFRTILFSAHRYVAYTSDVGESFRLVAHPHVVRAAYGISWLYILGDVSHEGYKAYWHNQRRRDPTVALSPRQQRITGLDAAAPVTDEIPNRVVSPLEGYRTVMVQRALFQSIASMGLPALTIYSIVKYSGRAMRKAKSPRLRTWGPIGLGLSVVPFLPAMYDRPVENAVEWAFHRVFSLVGGKAGVGDAPVIGRETELSKRPSGLGKKKGF